ncbi:MAG: patatin-like phospholipase family protein [Alicyclobacillus herbarius]|uniref:patatin-like phospholipase family protein n=1 Tax=Alicyclobacillus herbarius TaxID=122960 RepID=UPI000425971F|nr:patatin-like phospholipase family protein [Alicyclobacillus herbarius]MCL6632131.1 patatin-like phospholipase family protein [Alicyclobacillus herbarius]
MSKRRIALALGSGGAKGFAHVGVLQALVEHQISVDIVTGSSMGSLVGAFYVTGMSPSFMEKLACTLRWRHWVDLTVPKVGLIAGDKVHQMVKLLTRGLRIEELEIPFAAVATDLVQRRAVVIREGLLADAVRASIAIPGVFVPLRLGGQVLVDGGVIERVPTEAARALGADLVIGVDVSTGAPSVPETMLDVIMQSLEIMQEQLLVQHPADLLITPDLSTIGSSHFHRAKEAIRIGYEAAKVRIPDIEDLIRSSREGHPPLRAPGSL